MKNACSAVWTWRHSDSADGGVLVRVGVVDGETARAWWTHEEDKEAPDVEGKRGGSGGGVRSQDKHCCLFSPLFSTSPAGLGALDDSLGGNQMLIKRKLHSIGWGQQNRKETLPSPLLRGGGEGLRGRWGGGDGWEGRTGKR